MVPSTITLQSEVGEEKYEQAVAFLRDFHSRRAASTSLPSSSLCCTLGAIDEQAQQAAPVKSFASCLQSTKIRKIATSKCLVDLDRSHGVNAITSRRIRALSEEQPKVVVDIPIELLPRE